VEFTAIGIFLWFGSAMALMAGVTLTKPGTFLDYAWKLNPHARSGLAPLGKSVGILLLLLSMTLGVAATGWLQRKKWGWQLATIIIAIQAVGDGLNALRGQFRAPWAYSLIAVFSCI
jgi:hypothetical protein